LHKILLCQYAVIRYAAANTLAVFALATESKSMQYIIEQILPSLSDPEHVHNRQGVIECIHRKFR
jgi:hypothetical protein